MTRTAAAKSTGAHNGKTMSCFPYPFKSLLCVDNDNVVTISTRLPIPFVSFLLTVRLSVPFFFLSSPFAFLFCFCRFRRLRFCFSLCICIYLSFFLLILSLPFCLLYSHTLSITQPFCSRFSLSLSLSHFFHPLTFYPPLTLSRSLHIPLPLSSYPSLTHYPSPSRPVCYFQKRQRLRGGSWARVLAHRQWRAWCRRGHAIAQAQETLPRISLLQNAVQQRQQHKMRKFSSA